MQALKGPALGLKVTAVLGAFFVLLQVILTVLSPEDIVESARQEGLDIATGVVIGGTVATGVLALIVCAVIFLGAQSMARAQNWNFAIIASVLAMIPCCSPCCPLGLPMGIWALMILTKTEVKELFEG